MVCSRFCSFLLSSGRRKSECFWIFICTAQFLTVTTQQLLKPNKAKNYGMDTFYMMKSSFLSHCAIFKLFLELRYPTLV